MQKDDRGGYALRCNCIQILFDDIRPYNEMNNMHFNR